MVTKQIKKVREMNENQKIQLKALIYERLNMVYKIHFLHENKLLEEQKLKECIKLPRKERRASERELNAKIKDLNNRIKLVENQNTELFRILTDDKIKELIENCTDLYSDFTELFVKAYFESTDKVELKASLLKKVNGTFEKFE
jgi:hypothetical protein